MNAVTDIAPTIERAQRSLLRFMTCGSVDDGKSTLIGRLLYDADAVAKDQLESLERDSKKFGTTGGALDFALLVDGLSAEREQGITIDVAFRYFATPRRSFIVADTPGHEQYTRNMATGASNVELAIILIDASKGILPQTRRHSFLVSTMNVRHVVLAINKMDLIDFSQEKFDQIVRDYCAMADSLGFETIVPIPICARDGDNIAKLSQRTPWYHSAALLDYLEGVTIPPASLDAPFHMPVQWVNRPDFTFRGYAGSIESGQIAVGDAVQVVPGGRRSKIARIVTSDGDLPVAKSGQAITLTLADEIDISRGDVIVAPGSPVKAAHAVEAQLLWMSDDALVPGRSYRALVGTAETAATVESVTHLIDIHSFNHTPSLAGAGLTSNQIGDTLIRFDRPVATALYDESRALGGFILIDRFTHETVALGVVKAVNTAPAAHAARAETITAPQREALRTPNALPVRDMIRDALLTFIVVLALGGGVRLAVGVALIDRLVKAIVKDRL